jgi:hypothetical protein
MVSRLLLHRAHCFRRARLGQPLLSTRRRLIGEEERLIGDDSIAADRADHAGGVVPVGYNTNDTPEALAAREFHEVKVQVSSVWFLDNPHKHTNPKCHTATGKYYMPLAIQHSY